MNPLPEYQYGAARTMVYLHGLYLEDCLKAWRQAKAVDLTLPETDDPSYVSLETLLWHVLGAAGSYMVWMCAQLGLPDPGIEPRPDAAVIESQAADYLAHIKDRWRLPLKDVPEARFHRPEYASSWGTRYCIDAMLEHAVMHAILHRVQLEELLAGQTAS